MRTRDKLAAELRKVAAASREHAADYEAFAKRAETGEFDDFGEKYACPITQLHAELTLAGFTKFAARVAAGEFDATKEESDEWAGSPAGQEAFKGLSPEMRRGLICSTDEESMEPQNFAMEYRPTLLERIWKRLGFRYHLGEHEPNDRAWDGWMQTRSVMHFDMRDRLRLLVSGRLTIKHTHHTDTPSPDVVHTRLDWFIHPPCDRAQD